MRRTATLIALSLLAATASADWKKDLKDAASQKAGGTVAQTLGVAYAPPAGAAAYIVNLKNGDTVTGPVTVVFGLRNAGICPAGLQSPDSGHHVLLVDDPKLDYTLAIKATDKILDYAKGQTEATLKLAPGPHTLQLLYVDWKNQSFNPAVVSEKLSFTVK